MNEGKLIPVQLKLPEENHKTLKGEANERNIGFLKYCEEILIEKSKKIKATKQ